jgi:hypothetical protein
MIQKLVRILRPRAEQDSDLVVKVGAWQALRVEPKMYCGMVLDNLQARHANHLDHKRKAGPGIQYRHTEAYNRIGAKEISYMEILAASCQRWLLACVG